jgi:hypothetical protein
LDQIGNYELLVWWNGDVFKERSKRGSIIRRHPSLFLIRVFLSKLVLLARASKNNEEHETGGSLDETLKKSRTG